MSDKAILKRYQWYIFNENNIVLPAHTATFQLFHYKVEDFIYFPMLNVKELVTEKRQHLFGKPSEKTEALKWHNSNLSKSATCQFVFWITL